MTKHYKNNESKIIGLDDHIDPPSGFVEVTIDEARSIAAINLQQVEVSRLNSLDEINYKIELMEKLKSHFREQALQRRGNFFYRMTEIELVSYEGGSYSNLAQLAAEFKAWRDDCWAVLQSRTQTFNGSTPRENWPTWEDILPELPTLTSPR